MSAPSSMWSSAAPPAPTLADVLSEEEQAVIKKMRAAKEAALKSALRKKERPERLAKLRAEVASLEAEEVLADV